MGLFLSVLDEKISTSDSGKDKTIRQLTDRMNDSVSILNRLFDSLLDISKLEAESLKPQITKFNVADLIVRLSGQFEVQTNASGLVLKTAPGDAQVQCDETLLGQILSNFLSNGIRYTKVGEIFFRVHKTETLVRIEVEDTGIGIPKNNVGYIFDDFFQVKNVQRNRSQGLGLGLGLGLGIAKRTADLLGLTLSVESKEGQGSTFAIEIPVVKSLTVKQDAAKVLDPSAKLNVKTILVFDDDPTVLESLKFRLKMLDHNTLAALSLEEAKDLLKQSKTQPDFIIFDLRLAEAMDGVQAIESLRTELKAPIPGVILTGDTSPDRLKYIENAGLPVLHKPVQANRLASILNETFG